MSLERSTRDSTHPINKNVSKVHFAKNLFDGNLEPKWRCGLPSVLAVELCLDDTLIIDRGVRRLFLLHQRSSESSISVVGSNLTFQFWTLKQHIDARGRVSFLFLLWERWSRQKLNILLPLLQKEYQMRHHNSQLLLIFHSLASLFNKSKSW